MFINFTIQEIEKARDDISMALELDPSNIHAISLKTLLLSSNSKNEFPKRKTIFQTLTE